MSVYKALFAVPAAKREVKQPTLFDAVELDNDTLRNSARRSAHLRMIKDGTLADAMRKEPPGRYCAFGGLNPHVVGVTEDVAVCRTCPRNEDCPEPWKASGY